MSPKGAFQFQVSKFKSQEASFKALGQGARLEGRETSFELSGAGIKDKDRCFNVKVLFFYGLRPGRFVVMVNHGESLRSVKTFNLK